MRLRGPWLITGAHLDTVVTEQSGNIPANGQVTLVMSPYTFFPDMVYGGAPAQAFFYMRPRGLEAPNPDIPQIVLKHTVGTVEPYAVKWRHVNP